MADFANPLFHIVEACWKRALPGVASDPEYESPWRILQHKALHLEVCLESAPAGGKLWR